MTAAIEAPAWRDYEDWDFDADLTYLGWQSHVSGQLWQRVAEGKRRD